MLGVSRYVDGSGSWVLGDMNFYGDSTKAGGLAITQNPANTTATSLASGSNAVFTSTAYSESSPVTVQWFVNTNDGTGFNQVTTGSTTLFQNGTSRTSQYTLLIDTNDQNQNGYEFEADAMKLEQLPLRFPATLTVVPPVAPSPRSAAVNICRRGSNRSLHCRCRWRPHSQCAMADQHRWGAFSEFR